MPVREKSKLRLLCMIAMWFACIAVAALWGVASAGDEGVRYDVAVNGAIDAEQRSLLESVSKSIELKDRLPATTALLRRRASDDVDRFVAALRSLGCYTPEVSFDIYDQQEPVWVVFHVDAGPLYWLESVDVQLTGEGGGKFAGKIPDAGVMGLQLENPARSAPIIDAESALVRDLKRQGYAFAKVEDRSVVADYETKGVKVTYWAAPGPRALFGPVSVVGLHDVKENFIKPKIPWKEGDVYNADLLPDLQSRLTETHLFSLVRVLPAEALDEEGRLPITIDLSERKRRTVSAGANYYTDTGVGVKVAWEDRNVFGKGEDLSLEALASSITYSWDVQYTKPSFLREDQSLIALAKVASDDTDAYLSRNTEFSVLLERWLSRQVKVGAGPGFRFARIGEVNNGEDDGNYDDRKNYALLSFPVYFNLDASDDLLNPVRGSRLVARVTPYTDTLTSAKFLKSYASYSHYLSFSNKWLPIIANRAALGSIVGEARDGVPADVRFYAGGGGSIRGYPYQKVGPMDDDDPVGGASLIELSTELRFKVTESIGFVVFMDGGSAFESNYPDFGETLRWGAGTGVRYYTPIGPLRVDVAFPLNPADGMNDSMQLYLSIGQAF